MEPPPSEELSPETYHRGRKPMAGVVAAATAAAGLAWACLRFRPGRVRIDGASMVPTLMPEDWALVVSPRSYHRGDVVVVEHPGRPGYEMVKRVVGAPDEAVGERVLGRDEWWVQGDHEASSTDSRHFGPVTSAALKAKVVLIYWPKERRRRIR